MAGESLFYGATVERSADGSTAWAAIPNVQTIGIPEEDVDYQEVTSLDSPNGYREYIAGLKDAGIASMTQAYSRAAATQLDADKGALLYYRITFPVLAGQSTADTLVFQAIRTGNPTMDDIGAPIGISNSLRISGEPVWTAGT